MKQWLVISLQLIVKQHFEIFLVLYNFSNCYANSLTFDPDAILTQQ